MAMARLTMIYISISDIDEDKDLTLSRVDEWVGEQ